MLRQFGVAVVASALFLSSAQAGSLSSVEGTAMVNRGDGFKAMTAGSELRPGDKILLSRDSKARVTFRDGCVVSLDAGQTLSLTDKSPCSAMGPVPTTLNFSGRMGQSTTDQPDPTLLLLGGAAVIGGAIAIIASQNDGNKKPASP